MNDLSNGEVTRRRFLQGAAAAAGMGSVATGLAGEPKSGKPKLPTNTLGRTKLKVTRVTYGSLHTSGGRGEQVLKLVVDAGVNMVHNHAGYRGGNAMRAMAKVFEANPGMRDKLVLSLKGKDRKLERELDKTLTALHTDHVDVYLPTLHNADKGRLDELRKVQDGLKKKGKIRFKGFVCHGDLNDVLEMVLADAPDYFDAALLSTQMIIGAKGKTAGDEVRFVKTLGELKKHGLGVISMKSKAREAMAKGPDVFQAHCKTLLAGGADTVLFTFATIQQVDTLKKIDLTTTAMAPWERRLADAFHRSCEDACLMCGKCARSCPQGIPVSDLMRIRMYHDEHHDVGYARDTYRDLEGDLARMAAGCGSCTECKDVCPVGLASAEKVRYVTSLFA